MELNMELESAKKRILGHGGSSRAEKKDTEGKKPWTGFEASSSRKGLNESQESFLQNKSCHGEIKELNKRLQALEEETEKMKEAFFWGSEERKVIVNEIYKHFKSLNLQGFLQSRDFEDWRVKESLPEILGAYKNPNLITKELRVGAFTLQDPFFSLKSIEEMTNFITTD